jgi:hypothetical protein
MNITKIGNFHQIGLIQSFKQVKNQFGIREFYKGVGLATVNFDF